MSRALVRRETTAGYLFLLPSLFFFLTFVVYPMLMCIFTSFFDSNMGKNTQDVFIGLKNYTEGFIKEGAGAGGAMFLALMLGNSIDEIRESIEDACS